MLTIKKELLQEVIVQCARELPNEACGIFAGKDGRLEKVYQMVNTEKSPELFLMDAKEQLKVTKDIRNSGLEMAGIYHSHVSAQAYPSNHDVEMAFYPDVSYVIISLKDKNNPVARAFKIKDAKITEEEIKIA